MTRALAILILLAATACNSPYRAEMDATKAVVAERIAKGQMTEAEGNLVIARLRRQQINAMSAGDTGPTVYQRTGPNTVVAY